jgi:hypothetical protein
MAGKGGARPGAGRKPLADENKMINLIGKCFDVTLRFVQDETIPLKDRVDIASRISAKRVPSDVNLGGQPGNPIEQKAILTWQK